MERNTDHGLAFCPTCDGNTYLGSIGAGDERRCPTCEGEGLVPDASSVPDPIADTARALAGLWSEAARGEHDSVRAGRRLVCNARRTAIEDAARACGIQVEAAFRALVTGDAGRAPEVKP